MKYFFFVLIIFTYSCTKQKSILICGDHKCINKSEAKQYFEENLTIEVQIITKKKKSSFNLVDLNMGQKDPDIKVFKNKNNKVVKKLSKEEIKIKKAELKKKQKKSKLRTKTDLKETVTANKNSAKKEVIMKQNTSLKNSYNKSIDICLKLEKCDIDSITNYLTKLSNEKDFPNISSID